MLHRPLRCLLLILLLSGCEKNNTPKPNSSDYFFEATINNHPWKATGPSSSYFGTSYIYEKNRFILSIGGTDTTLNSACQYMSIGFDFVPKPGRYYFNNDGSDQLDSGIIALYVYTDINHSSDKWSTGGYVDINTLTKDNIKGSFNFTARGDVSDSSLSTITSGSFSAIYTGGNGMTWPGP